MTQEEKDKLILQFKIIRDGFFSNYVLAKDKQLLLEDLNARLFYGVKVTTINPAAEFGIVSGISIEGKISVRTKDADIVFECTEVKPYLRSMSSMTKEELFEVQDIIGKGVEIRDVFIDIVDSTIKSLSYAEIQAVFDWLNKNMFDYRGLIEKELAIEVTEKNNPYEN